MKIIVPIFLMLFCFLASAIFFINSEIMDITTGEINTEKVVEIVMELDQVPFLNIGMNPELIQEIIE